MLERTWTAQQGWGELLQLMENPGQLTLNRMSEIIAKLSIDAGAPEGATTYLYSGSIIPKDTLLGKESLSAETIAKQLCNETTGRIINNTEAAKFLLNRDFGEIVEQAVKNTYPELVGDDIDMVVMKYIYGSDDGVWAKVSKDFVAETKGTVECIVPDAAATRVWNITEVVEMLENGKIQSANGLTWDEVRRAIDTMKRELGYSEATARDVVAEQIRFHSIQQIHDVEFVQATDHSVTINTQNLTGVKTSFPEGSSVHTVGESWGELSRKDLLRKYPSMKTFYDYAKNEEFPWLKTPSTALEKGLDHLQYKAYDYTLRCLTKANPESPWHSHNRLVKIGQDVKHLGKGKMGAIIKGLGNIGQTMILLDGIATAKRAFDTAEEGEYQQAKEIVRDWTFGTVGGLVAAEIAGTIAAGIGAALVVAGGPVGLILAAEIAAGIGGYAVGRKFGELFGDWFDRGYSAAFGAMTRVDPIVLDLDADGVETLSQKNGTYFDLDNNTFAEKTGWVHRDDGILVLDRNANGQIDNGAELFGDQSVLQNGQQAKSGYEALAELDTNQDGKIDAQDDAYVNLRIWRDLNQDGQNTQGELFSLDALGIKALHLRSTVVQKEDANGNLLLRTGTWEKTDGTTQAMGEYLLARNTRDTQSQEDICVPEEIQSLPDIQGMGNVYSLHQAMARDAQGTLKEKIQAFAAEHSPKQRKDKISSILIAWAKADHIDPKSRGTAFDAQKLVVIEKFGGRSLVGSAGENPTPQAAHHLEKLYRGLSETVYTKLLFQTHYKELWRELGLGWDLEKNKLQLNLPKVLAYVQAKLEEDPTTGETYLSDLGRMLRTIDKERPNADSYYKDYRNYFVAKSQAYEELLDLATFEAVLGSEANDTMMGTETQDLLGGGAGDDTLRGGEGDDLLCGQAGADTLEGGGGDDALYGGEGDDRLCGGAGNDLLEGGAGADYLVGETGNDALKGGSGDDRLYGNIGDDTLEGGEGADYLEGGSGNDTYVFQRGGGQDTLFDNGSTGDTQDTIRLQEGIQPENVILKRMGNDMQLLLKGTQDSLYIRNQQISYESIERIEFADGTCWDKATIDEKQRKIEGTTGDDNIVGYEHDDAICGEEGNDILRGQGGNDTLEGGEGADYLEGGSGNDTYVFQRGGGQDTLFDNGSTGDTQDTIRLQEGIQPEDVILKRMGNGMQLLLKGTQDSLYVRNQQISYESIERIEFADGTCWDKATIDEKQRKIEGTTGDDTLRANDSKNHQISGGAGNDRLYGAGGNDTLEGGAGNDYLEGGAGNDTYVFGKNSGDDTLSDYDSTAGNKDSVQLAQEAVDLLFQKEGNSLKILMENSSLTIASWYSGSSYQIEEIKSSDGKSISNLQIQLLIQAMATFETDQGISWNQAIQERPSEVQTILSQFWVQE